MTEHTFSVICALIHSTHERLSTQIAVDAED
jgi:hypothetical protein